MAPTLLSLPAELVEDLSLDEQLEEALLRAPTKQTVLLDAATYADVQREIRRRQEAGQPKRRCTLQAIALEGIYLTLARAASAIGAS